MPLRSIQKTLLLFIYLTTPFYACTNVDTKSKITTPAESVSDSSKNDSSAINKENLFIENKDTLSKSDPIVISKKNNVPPKQVRTIESFSDAKLNGEPILIQEELSESILINHPDTIINYLKAVYLNEERNFPRSISDNFEKGISTERIHYPRLNYRVELFKDGYARNSYRTFEYSVRNENGILIVE